jgi:hypothetical protein
LITSYCESIKAAPPRTIIHDPVSATNNRYLELADLAFGNSKSKKKSKARSLG